MLALLLAGTALLLVPNAAAGTYNRTFLGSSGVPASPQCAPDNNYEQTRPEGDTMFFPNEGCTATYSPRAYGILPQDDLRVLQVEFRVTGHVGTICGHFEFIGRVAGSSSQICTGHDELVRVPVSSTPSDADEFIIVVWRTSTNGGHDNAYLYNFVVQGESASQSTPPPPPSPPCALGAPGGSCLIEDGFCRQVDCILEKCDGELPGSEDTDSPPPPDCTVPPCVTGDPQECLVGVPCFVGPTWAECIVEQDPGCGTVCPFIEDGFWILCASLTPVGLVGTVIILVLGSGYKVYCTFHLDDDLPIMM